jgi:hypothetical protein
MTEYSWSIDSAAWQIANGDPDSERTQSAADYLDEQIVRTESADWLRYIASKLLTTIHERIGDE